MIRPEPTISATVWRRGWQLEAVATQAASAEVGRFIRWLEERGLHESAGIIRQMAMRHGVRKAEADLQAALNATCGKRRTAA